MRLLLPLAVLAFVPGVTSAAAPPPELVRRVLDAYGGRAALERVKAVRQEGTVTSTMRGGATGRLVRVLQPPGSLRVEIAYPGEETEVRVLHRGRGERNRQDVTGPPLDAMVLQAARLSLPLALAAKGARVEDRGEVTRDGRRLRALALSLPGDLELVVEIDAGTHRVVRSSGTMPGPMGRMEFATEYSRFQRVGGVLFPMHEENYVGGQRSGATDLTTVTLLPRAPDGAFDERI